VLSSRLSVRARRSPAFYGLRPAYAIYEPCFVRLGAALARAAGGTPQPVYRFMFSEGFSYCFPPTEYALDAYLQLLASEAPGAPRSEEHTSAPVTFRSRM